MINEITSYIEINIKTQNKLRGLTLFGDTYPHAYNEFNSIETNKQLPEFNKLANQLEIDLNIGIENYTGGIVASHKLIDIVLSRKNANKQAQLFNLISFVLFGVKDNYQINKYYKKLNLEQRSDLNNILNGYIVHTYNQLIELYNYNLEG